MDKKNPPAELGLDSNMVIIYTTNNVDTRQSKASVTKNSRLRISNKNNFETFITSPSSKTGFEVEYEINNITEKGFIFIDSLDINDVTQKYKSWKNKNDSSNSEYYYCAEKGIYDGEKLIIDKAFTLNSYKIKINHVVKIKEDNTEEDKGSGYILCETRVEDDSDLKCYSWTLNNQNYKTFIEKNYIRNDSKDKHLETKRYPRSEEEKKNPTTYLPVEYDKKESNCILLYTTESSNNRFAKTVVASNTIFYFSNENIISNYLNNYDKKKGLEVSYKNSDGKIQSGYLYIDSLNEKTAEKNNADKIKEDYNKWIKSIPNNTEETKNFENIFELSVKLKDGISVNNVIAPAEKELRRNSIVGYAGYTITSEESEDVWKNDDATTIHFEIFTNDCEFMKYKEGTPCSCILKVNSECTLQKGKLKTVTRKRNLKFLPLIKEYNQYLPPSAITQLLNGDNSCYKNGILKLLGSIKLVDGEEFYEMKFIGKVSQLLSDEYVERDECFTEWDDTSSTWKGKADLEAANIYTKDGVMKSGKTIKIYKKLRYNWLSPTGGTVVKNGKKLELRKAAYFYEYFDKENESDNFYIRKEIFARLKPLDTANDEYYMESNQSILFKDILDMPTRVEWNGETITKKEGNLIFKGKTLKQYTTASSNTPTFIWEAVGLENSTEEYWVPQSDISEREGNKPLEKIIFDKWDNFFKEIDLTSIGQYKGKLEDKETLEGLKLNSQIINDYETEKNGRLGTTEQFTVSDYLNSSGYINNYYFKNMTEWNNDSGLTDELCKTTQLKEKIKTQRKETAFWQEASSLKDFPKASEDKYYYFHPVTFLQHLDKVVAVHAEELRRVQNRIIKMKTIQENGPGLYNKTSETFCNHAAYLAIRALDKDYKKFLYYMEDKSKYLDEPTYRDSDERWTPLNYEYKSSNFWCDVLAQKANDKTCSIEELTTPAEVQEKANLGYVVIVCWKNEIKLKDRKGKEDVSPHYATVWPSGKNISKIEDIYVANVSVRKRTKVLDITTAFTNGNLRKLHFYYNSEQKFTEDYSYISTLEERDGVEQ